MSKFINDTIYKNLSYLDVRFAFKINLLLMSLTYNITLHSNIVKLLFSMLHSLF